MSLLLYTEKVESLNKPLFKVGDTFYSVNSKRVQIPEKRIEWFVEPAKRRVAKVVYYTYKEKGVSNFAFGYLHTKRRRTLDGEMAIFNDGWSMEEKYPCFFASFEEAEKECARRNQIINQVPYSVYEADEEIYYDDKKLQEWITFVK